uniref:Uncharacterized protein n=1 Tax=Caulobacter sp. (strain K31) TaxID=366602 RepID=B0SYH1_CAUSK
MDQQTLTFGRISAAAMVTTGLMALFLAARNDLVWDGPSSGTSPPGAADLMETLTRVDLEAETMRRVVEAEGGCLAWGGAVGLSPADDILIRVERVLDIERIVSTDSIAHPTNVIWLAPIFVDP